MVKQTKGGFEREKYFRQIHGLTREGGLIIKSGSPLTCELLYIQPNPPFTIDPKRWTFPVMGSYESN